MGLYSFPKKEKLKSKKLIEQLFEEGKSVKAYPLKLIYMETSAFDDTIIKAGFTVPKRNFKLAVKRNRIKRLLKEAYRLQKHELFNKTATQYAFMFLYLGNQEPTFKQISKKMELLLRDFLDKQNI